MASRRDLIRMTAGELRAFLDEQRIVQVATVGPSGRPHLMPLWYFVEEEADDPAVPAHDPDAAASGRGATANAPDAVANPGNTPALRGWTYAKSQKARNLERDPRATISIDDGVQYQELRGAMMECDVEVERDPEAVAGYGLPLFERYGPGGELAPEVREMVLAQARKRVGLRFVPTRVVTWDHGKLGGGY